MSTSCSRRVAAVATRQQSEIGCCSAPSGAIVSLQGRRRRGVCPHHCRRDAARSLIDSPELQEDNDAVRLGNASQTVLHGRANSSGARGKRFSLTCTTR